MTDQTIRRNLFKAIDPLPGNHLLSTDERWATRWVFVRVMPAKTAANARRFLRDLHPLPGRALRSNGPRGGPAQSKLPKY